MRVTFLPAAVFTELFHFIPKFILAFWIYNLVLISSIEQVIGQYLLYLLFMFEYWRVRLTRTCSAAIGKLLKTVNRTSHITLLYENASRPIRRIPYY